jgi:hypothetical protein
MRVVVVINKWWECDPALAAMLNNNTRPAGAPWPTALQPTRRVPEQANEQNLDPIPRAVFGYKNFSAEAWCVSDLLDGLTTDVQSSSEQKAKRLHKIFEYGERAGLVIAVGTASTPSVGVNRNGGVVVGTSVFMHNGYPNDTNPASNFESKSFDRLIESSISPAMFEKIQSMDTVSALNRFLPVPLNPSLSVDISIGMGDVALGTINVTQSADYTTKDPLTIQAFQALGTKAVPVSLETTHALIREKAEDSPFIFVSGIVNRFQQFGTDVVPRLDAQNTIGAHNAGVVVTWMLSSLDAQL